MSDPHVFDLDEAASGFEPVRIKLRGQEYTLAATAASLLVAIAYAAEHFGGEDTDLARIAEHVRPMFQALAPDAPQDLTLMEELALVRPVTELLNRISSLSFRAEE